jgi:hypothetical protein
VVYEDVGVILTAGSAGRGQFLHLLPLGFAIARQFQTATL